jgi:hypothetical protein
MDDGGRVKVYLGPWTATTQALIGTYFNFLNI